ncbi:unnamed protein product, partial [Chrysoparadoxa australica]
GDGGSDDGATIAASGSSKPHGLTRLRDGLVEALANKSFGSAGSYSDSSIGIGTTNEHRAVERSDNLRMLMRFKCNARLAFKFMTRLASLDRLAWDS